VSSFPEGVESKKEVKRKVRGVISALKEPWGIKCEIMSRVYTVNRNCVSYSQECIQLAEPPQVTARRVYS